MAKIENDVLILTDNEKSRLRKNLLNPPANIDRDKYLNKIEKLEFKETENGFVVCFNEVEI